MFIVIYSCASIYVTTIQHIAHSCPENSLTFHGIYPLSMDSYSLKFLSVAVTNGIRGVFMFK